MKSIRDLTDKDAFDLANIQKYDIPDDPGVKEELISIYEPDIENLTFGNYLPLNLYFKGLSALIGWGYDMSELIEKLCLPESSSPSPLKDVIEEMEKLLAKSEYDQNNSGNRSYFEGRIDVLEYFIPKLKQIGEGSDDWELFWKEAQGCIKYGEPSLEELKSKWNLILK